jgi:predicted acylesterase/phospholipase RssA
MAVNVRDRGKTALVLAGGGLTGAVYEIGALRAIDDLLIDRTVNDFDIFIGTSAGALINAFIANGISPEQMLRVLDGTSKEAKPIQTEHIFNLNREYYLKWGLRVPKKLLKAWSHYLRYIQDMTFFDLVWSLSEALPSGFYDSLGLHKFVSETLNSLGHPNNFDECPRDLYIIATDLDSGERAIFGREYSDEIPISLAVAASSALPMVYKPVRIGNHEYIDGGLRGTASLDLAIEKGATLVVCINPLVPYDNRSRDSIPYLGQDGGFLSGKGIQSIANQSLRILSHSGLHYHVKQLRRAHPEVDIILIEPQTEDYQMSFYNIMRYSARLIVAQHGFESVTLDLASDYQYFKQVLARHGIPISRSTVIDELSQIASSNNDPNVVRKVLEARTHNCGSRKRGTPICQLNRVLAELEFALENIEEDREEESFQRLWQV